MDRDFKIITAIADVHIGNRAISWSEYRYQIEKSIIDKMKQMVFLDGIVVCGDTLHCQISLNSEYANIFQWFIAELVKIAKKKNAFIRIIKGTKSHDLDQLETVRQYENNPDVDFKIINDYLIETIDNHNYVYIAENYIDESVYKYYSEIFDKSDSYFDMLFMHGMIDKVQYVEQTSENISTSAPIFKLRDLLRVSKLCIGGHIHIPMNFKDRFFYVGSALRTAHGEEEDKGWNVIAYMKNNGQYRVDKIINEYAFKFNTLHLNDQFISENKVDTIINYVEQFNTKHGVDKLSLKITCVDTAPNVVKCDILKKYFNKNPNITSRFKLLSEKSYEQEETIRHRQETKPYLKSGLDILDQIQLWAKIERNYELNKEEIARFITPKTLDRKEK